MISCELGQTLHVVGLAALWSMALAGIPALVEWIGGDH